MKKNSRKIRKEKAALMKQVESEKSRLLEESLVRHGIEVNKEDEARRTFKTLCIKQLEGKEYVFHNDGSIDGKLLLVLETVAHKDKETDEYKIEIKPFCTAAKIAEENGETKTPAKTMKLHGGNNESA